LALLLLLSASLEGFDLYKSKHQSQIYSTNQESETHDQF